jgi:integral membrane protein
MKHSNKNIALIKTLSQTGILEGWSYILLLGVAMPLKYIGGIPEAVKYIGWAHGVLFILFCILVAKVKFTMNWSYKWAAIAFIASLLPAGTFFLDKQLKKEIESLKLKGATA